MVEGDSRVAARIEREDLEARLRGGALSPRRAAQIALGVFRAVMALHAAGILHRDLKPANVLLRPDAEPATCWLLDSTQDDWRRGCEKTLLRCAPNAFRG